MKKLTKAQREALRQIGSIGGKNVSQKMTPAELKARAKAAGIASGKARRKKAGK